jgi:hypothetical protein
MSVPPCVPVVPLIIELTNINNLSSFVKLELEINIEKQKCPITDENNPALTSLAG